MISAPHGARTRTTLVDRKIWMPVLVAASLALILLGALPAAQRYRARVTTESFRYPFELAPRGSVARALENEIAVYQERIRRDPQGGLDLAALGGAYLAMARATGDLSWYLLAEQAARRSLANLPFSNTGAVVVLARVAEGRHDFAEAIRLAQQAAGKEEALAVLVTANLATGKVDQARQAAETLVEQSPTLGGFALRALVSIALGEDDAAVRDFSRAIAAEQPGETGGSAQVRAYFGRFHARRGRLDLARQLYQGALRIFPQYPLALVGMAELEARARNYGAAERLLSQVVTISSDPNVFDHVVFRGMGRLKALQGDHAGANAMWDQAEARLRKDVAQGAFGHRRELAHLLLERGRPGDAEEALRLIKVEVEARRDAETLSILAWALSRNGRLAEAREAMREALRSGVRDAAMVYRAGMIEDALGNRAQARAFFRTVSRIDSTFDEQARRALGMGF